MNIPLTFKFFINCPTLLENRNSCKWETESLVKPFFWGKFQSLTSLDEKAQKKKNFGSKTKKPIINFPSNYTFTSLQLCMESEENFFSCLYGTNDKENHFILISILFVERNGRKNVRWCGWISPTQESHWIVYENFKFKYKISARAKVERNVKVIREASRPEWKLLWLQNLLPSHNAVDRVTLIDRRSISDIIDQSRKRNHRNSQIINKNSRLTVVDGWINSPWQWNKQARKSNGKLFKFLLVFTRDTSVSVFIVMVTKYWSAFSPSIFLDTSKRKSEMQAAFSDFSLSLQPTRDMFLLHPILTWPIFFGNFCVDLFLAYINFSSLHTPIGLIIRSLTQSPLNHRHRHHYLALNLKKILLHIHNWGKKKLFRVVFLQLLAVGKEQWSDWNVKFLVGKCRMKLKVAKVRVHWVLSLIIRLINNSRLRVSRNYYH